MANELTFIAEQDGEVEFEFKSALISIFSTANIPLRSYLVLGKWQPNELSQPILCLRVPGDEDLQLLDKCSAIFNNLFAENQHLDIVFINSEQEQRLRKLCCPFYTSKRYNLNLPDFYLFSHEGYRLDDEPRACFMRKRI